MRRLCLALLAAAALAVPAAAQDFNMEQQIAMAQAAMDNVLNRMGGMGGLGAMPERDIAALNGMLDEAERLLRQAKLARQNAKGVHDEALAVAYARAAQAIAETARALGSRLGVM